jgi:hypothetical protein
MPDCVLDASFVGMANDEIDNLEPGSILDRRISIICEIKNGSYTVRYNSRLLGEYNNLVKVHRNDWIAVFFQILADGATFVNRNNFNAAELAKARKCRWPLHDQHVLVAAINGTKSIVFVTESTLGRSAAKVLQHFRVRIKHIA